MKQSKNLSDNLRALLKRCRKEGIKLIRQKMQMNRDSMTFCDQELTKAGVRPDSQKIDAIKRMPASADRKGVQRLLGFAQYLAKFCPNFNDLTSSIRELPKHENEFCWRPKTHGAALKG